MSTALLIAFILVAAVDLLMYRSFVKELAAMRERVTVLTMEVRGGVSDQAIADALAILKRDDRRSRRWLS